MEIRLLYNSQLKSSKTKEDIPVLNNIADQIFDSSFGNLYSKNDVDRIDFHYKIESLYVCLYLSYIESDDVIDSIKSRLRSELGESKSGLFFINVNKYGYIPRSNFDFWYYLTPQEITLFNECSLH